MAAEENGVYEVVIIGAGVSGLSAGKSIEEMYRKKERKRGAGNEKKGERKQKVLVLEARDRIGGRIQTIRESGKCDDVFDMGANYIHGIKGNPIYKLCQQHKIKTVNASFENETILPLDSKDIESVNKFLNVLPIEKLLDNAREHWHDSFGPDSSASPLWKDIPLSELFSRFLLSKHSPNSSAYFALNWALHASITCDYGIFLSSFLLPLFFNPFICMY